MALHNFAVSFSQSREEKFQELKKLRERSIKEIDSFSRIDLLNKNYLYLDKQYHISIDSANFNKAVKKFNYKKNLINNYEDSLSVVLTYELNSFHGSRIAKNMITQKWEKIGYYLWLSDKDAKKVGNNFGFNHPYQFYKYLVDDNINNTYKTRLLNDLKLNHINLKEKNIKPYESFLNLAFELNPKRLKAMENYIKKSSQHKH